MSPHRSLSSSMQFCRCAAALALMCSVVGCHDSDSGRSNVSAEALCGQYCVQHCCRLFGAEVDMPRIMKVMPPRRQGNSMWEVKEALEWAGLKAEGYSVTFEELASGPFPIVAHTTRHFVVVEAADKKKVRLLDGVGRRQVVDAKIFKSEWDGRVLVISPPAAGEPFPKYIGRAAQGQPRIRFQTLVKDMGPVEASAAHIDFTFPFRNEGTGELRIKKIRTTCKCTVAEQPTGPVPPNGEGLITIRLTPGGRLGRFGHRSYVETNDPAAPVIPLIVSGNFAPKVFRLPLAFFARVVAGEKASARVLLVYRGDRELKVFDAETSVKGVSVSVYGKDGPPGRSKRPKGAIRVRRMLGTHVVVATADTKGWPPGKVEGDVVLHTNLEKSPAIRVPLRLEILAPLVVSPSKVFFGELDSGSTERSSVSLFLRSGRSLKITGVHTELAGATWQIGKSPVGAPEVQFTFTAASGSGYVEEAAVLDYTLENGAEVHTVQVPLCAYVKARTGGAKPSAASTQ